MNLIAKANIARVYVLEYDFEISKRNMTSALGKKKINRRKKVNIEVKLSINLLIAINITNFYFSQ